MRCSPCYESFDLSKTCSFPRVLLVSMPAVPLCFLYFCVTTSYPCLVVSLLIRLVAPSSFHLHALIHMREGISKPINLPVVQMEYTRPSIKIA
jgi:hypothetical protein